MPRHFLTVTALLIACLGPAIASAALGEAETSIQSDAARFQGVVHTTEHVVYRVHEIETPSGTMLREFVAQDGAVFAVAWRGPVVPNLREILGQYFDKYVDAAKASSPHRRRIEVNQADLVVHASGHMRAFSGIVYLPRAVPAGMTADELR